MSDTLTNFLALLFGATFFVVVLLLFRLINYVHKSIATFLQTIDDERDSMDELIEK